VPRYPYSSNEAAHDLSFALAFDGAAFDLRAGSSIFSHADEHDPPERFVGGSVAAWVQSFACDEAR